MLPSVVIAAGGAVFTAAPAQAPRLRVLDWAQAHRVFLGSAAMALFAAFLSSCIHLALAR